MQAETLAAIESIKSAVDLLRKHVGWDTSSDRVAAFEAQISAPDFWDNQENAQRVMREKTHLDQQISAITELETKLQDQIDLIELAEEENDIELVVEANAELTRLAEIAGKKQLESLLSGEADGNNCFIEIHPGAGGTEAQDWAAMLLRMYSRWAEARGFKLEIIEESDGEEAGIKSATLRVMGVNAYGWMKTESGVHRLVRISPYDSSARRHTSFASVWIYPEVDDNIDVALEEKDLRAIYRYTQIFDDRKGVRPSEAKLQKLRAHITELNSKAQQKTQTGNENGNGERSFGRSRRARF